MAKKKKKTAVKKGVQDERFPKLLGLFMLFLSLYLFIAFSSYLFTWKEDADKAHWGTLLTPTEMDNWLGRLGAVLSHQFFYYGFGFSSFIFVFLILSTGMSLITETPIKKLYPVYQRSFIVMLWTSFLFAFMTQSSGFPWGGAFGSVLVGGLNNFVGPAGIIILLIFAFLAVVIWNNNPDLSDGLQMEEIKGAFTPENVQDTLKNMFRLTPVPELEPEPVKTKTVKVLQPKNKFKNTNPDMPDFEGDLGNNAAHNASDKAVTVEIPKTIDQSTKEELAKKVQKLTQNQLSLDLDKSKEGGDSEDAENGPVEMEIGKGEKIDVSITEENKNHVEPYDPTLDLPKYENPVLDLLESYDDQKPIIDRAELEANKDQIIETLLNYKIEIVKINSFQYLFWIKGCHHLFCFFLKINSCSTYFTSKTFTTKQWFSFNEIYHECW